jgi:hypothetical protein
MTDMTPDNEWICHLCFPKAVEYGWLLPGYYLYKQSPEDTVYRVENSQGHGDDVFMFSEPIADPGDEADDDTFWSFIKFAEKAFDKPIRPEEGWKLTAAAIEAGWSREDDGGLCFWLADRAAKIIKTKEEKK